MTEQKTLKHSRYRFEAFFPATEAFLLLWSFWKDTLLDWFFFVRFNETGEESESESDCCPHFCGSKSPTTANSNYERMTETIFFKYIYICTECSRRKCVRMDIAASEYEGSLQKKTRQHLFFCNFPTLEFSKESSFIGKILSISIFCMPLSTHTVSSR